MPFDTTALVPLLSGSGFTLWLYRTADTRAQALAAGYFNPAAARLETGDMVLLQSADAVTLTTVRPGDVVAAGVVVDTAAAPFRVNRGAAQRFSVRQAAAAVAATVLLAPLAGSILAGGTVQAQAAVAGPVAQLAFTIRDAAGATVRGPATATVAAGAAAASLPAPPAGSFYRLRVEAPGLPGVADTSPPFAVTEPWSLLAQTGAGLLQQDGFRLLV